MRWAQSRIFNLVLGALSSPNPEPDFEAFGLEGVHCTSFDATKPPFRLISLLNSSNRLWHRRLPFLIGCMKTSGDVWLFRNHRSVSFGPVFVQSGQRAVITAPNRGVRKEISIGRLNFSQPICIKDAYQRY